MHEISAEHKTFFKQILDELILSKLHDLVVLRNKVIDYKQKSKNITVDNSAYAKKEALKGYMLEYVKTYKEVEKLIKEYQG